MVFRGDPFGRTIFYFFITGLPSIFFFADFVPFYVLWSEDNLGTGFVKWGTFGTGA